MTEQKPGYVIISPVKDEAEYIGHTLCAVTSQTIRPAEWVIVNDGSTDSTADIARRVAAEHSFIHVIDVAESVVARRPGAGVIQAFNYGYNRLASDDYSYLVKLDCDLSFSVDYFERLLERFAADETLGIASGVYLERSQAGDWRQVSMPGYHAFGACKVLRRRCFDDIGGFVAAKGWDTIDEIRATHRGWRTRNFPELEVQHLKPEGSGIGPLRTGLMHGQIYYATGGDPLSFAIKGIRRLFARPFVVGSLALVVGYVGAVLSKRPKLVTETEERLYRRMLRQRLLFALRGAWSQRGK